MVNLHKSLDEEMNEIEAEFENRLVLFCEDCQEMTRYTADSLTWHCSECGGGDLTTERVKELIAP